MNNIISVLLPVYNGSEYIGDAINSVLSQTFREFELIVIDDGSSDTTVKIVEEIHDPRITLVCNPKNIGIAGALNKGLSLVKKSKYFARMDSDDLCHPERFRKQIDFLEKHPEVDVCGTGARLFQGATGSLIHPSSNDDIKTALYFYCSIAHPTVVIRSELITKYHIEYDEKFVPAEDFWFWHSIKQKCRFHNLQEELLDYRVSKKSLSNSSEERKKKALIKIFSSVLPDFGFQPSVAEVEFHTDLILHRLKIKHELKDVYKAKSWFMKLIRHNNTSHCCSKNNLMKLFKSYWWQICRNSTEFGVLNILTYLTAPFYDVSKIKTIVTESLRKS